MIMIIFINREVNREIVKLSENKQRLIYRASADRLGVVLMGIQLNCLLFNY